MARWPPDLSTPSWAIFYNPSVQKYEYNPAKAQQLLEAAGWRKGPDGILTNSQSEKFEILFNGPKGYPVMEQVIVYAQQKYQKLGFKVTLDIVEWPVHLQKYREGDYDLLMEWWITPPDPDLYNHYHSKSPSNWWAYANPEVDDLIVRARSEPDRARRVSLYHPPGLPGPPHLPDGTGLQLCGRCPRGRPGPPNPF
jgi:peptide/nickel transport system substrate-binding protein